MKGGLGIYCFWPSIFFKRFVMITKRSQLKDVSKLISPMQHLKSCLPALGLGISLQMLKGKITYNEAVDQEHNVLQALTYWQKREEFISYLLQHATEIEYIVKCYLRLKGKETCRLSASED